MHHKNIKLMVKKQLKREFPNWKRLPKKMKREIFSKVMAEVIADYDFKQKITAPDAELLGIENQMPAEGIIPLEEMAQYIDKVNSDLYSYFICNAGFPKMSLLLFMTSVIIFMQGLLSEQICQMRRMRYDISG